MPIVALLVHISTPAACTRSFGLTADVDLEDMEYTCENVLASGHCPEGQVPFVTAHTLEQVGSRFPARTMEDHFACLCVTSATTCAHTPAWRAPSGALTRADLKAHIASPALSSGAAAAHLNACAAMRRGSRHDRSRFYSAQPALNRCRSLEPHGALALCAMPSALLAPAAAAAGPDMDLPPPRCIIPCQIHLFIFTVAVMHVIMAGLMILLASLHIQIWRSWPEDELHRE